MNFPPLSTILLPFLALCAQTAMCLNVSVAVKNVSEVAPLSESDAETLYGTLWYSSEYFLLGKKNSDGDATQAERAALQAVSTLVEANALRNLERNLSREGCAQMREATAHCPATLGFADVTTHSEFYRCHLVRAMAYWALKYSALMLDDTFRTLVAQSFGKYTNTTFGLSASELAKLE